MTDSDMEVLARAHDLFQGRPRNWPVTAPIPVVATGEWSGDLAQGYRAAVVARDGALADLRHVDAEASRLIESALRSHQQAERDTAAVLAAARADNVRPDNPVAMRELMRRRASRLRAQRAHVRTARRRARQGRRALRALRYAFEHRRAPAGPRARLAVRAALSRLGRPYVWGATGPDRFDCSGLVKWAYAQAGISLPRTTYDQINEGVPVARSHVRPGDLVFPHAGHVQMAIGRDLVVEAPQPGESVRISRLGDYIAIRRP